MLFPARYWPGLADGSVTVAFRRQKRPTVKAGGTLRSPSGVLAIDEVTAIDVDDTTDEDAHAAGHEGRDEIIKALRSEGSLYRFRFHLEGEDPRRALRSQSVLTDDELDSLRGKLGRLDWSIPVLRLIRDNPGVVSTELAPQVGMERPSFKQKVRRLKELGLTESLLTGYRLSPRGESALTSLVDD